MSESRSEMFCLGSSHKSAPMNFRESIYLSPERLEESLPIIKNRYAFSEVMVLSTCNRMEMYVFTANDQPRADDDSRMEMKIHEAYLDLQRQANKKALPTYEELKAHTYLHRDQQALEHMFTVASSLDSMVIGETQITRQFKDALNLAQRAKTIGPQFNILSQEILTSVKKVRSKTALGEGTVSIAHMAVDLAKRIFTNLADRSFLFVGAGEMIRIASQYAASYKPKSISFVNRTVAKSIELRDQIGRGSTGPLSELPKLLLSHDIIITSTASQEPIITRKMLSESMMQRRGKSLFLVDIALPRDVEPECSELEDVYLFELDDLKDIVQTELGKRLAEVSQAQKILRRGMDRHHSRSSQEVSINLALKQFRLETEKIINREVRRTLSRSTFDTLSEKQSEALERLSLSINAQLTSHVARSLKSFDDCEDRRHLANSLSKIFNCREHSKKTKEDLHEPPN